MESKIELREALRIVDIYSESIYCVRVDFPDIGKFKFEKEDIFEHDGEKLAVIEYRGKGESVIIPCKNHITGHREILLKNIKESLVSLDYILFKFEEDGEVGELSVYMKSLKYVIQNEQKNKECACGEKHIEVGDTVVVCNSGEEYYEECYRDSKFSEGDSLHHVNTKYVWEG